MAKGTPNTNGNDPVADVAGVAAVDLGSAGTIADTAIDPTTLAGNSAGSDDGFARDGNGNIKYNADGSPAKRRGRKPGGSAGNSGGQSARKNKAPENSVSGIEAILFSVHAMAAAAFQVQELALGKDEAALLANAVANVAEHYPMEIAPRTLAWVNLVMAVSSIYGPRVYLYRQRVAKEQSEKPDATSVGFYNSGFTPSAVAQ